MKSISVENLSKSYRLGTIGSDTFFRDFERWFARARGKPDPYARIGDADHGNRDGEEVWALRDVSFAVEQGEVLGIIGKNGAGKSTLLKILSRVTAPTSGQIKVRGRIASLLEVGTGFHPELTGRENIYLNGAILGMTRAEVRRKFDEIVDFAGVETYIDTPVKRYSSGMYVRLAFAVAAHLEPEILVVDEVLAVGDAEFQKKCLGKMGEVAKGGRTVLFVSHNMTAVQSLCTRSLLVNEGRIQFQGSTNQVLSAYLHKKPDTIVVNNLASRNDRRGNGFFRFIDVKLYNSERKLTQGTSSGGHLAIHLHYTCAHPFDGKKQVVIRLGFTNKHRQHLFVCLSRSSSLEVLKISSCGKIVCIIPSLPLLPEKYYVDAWCKVNEILADEIQDAFTVEVYASDFYGTGKLPSDDGGSMLVNHFWQSS